jgi:acyl-homoserine lactone acylase PvdQ
LRCPARILYYADRYGVVAYFVSGYFPVRDGGYLPFNGSRGEGEWKRYVWLPSVLNYINPPYLATANNKVADANVYLQWRWADRYRHDRIMELLAQKAARGKIYCRATSWTFRGTSWTSPVETSSLSLAEYGGEKREEAAGGARPGGTAP